MTTPFSAPCDLITSFGKAQVESDFIVQPFPQPSGSMATLTLQLRLMASLLARLRLENNSKLAFFTCWLWVSDWKLGKAMLARIPNIATTTMNSTRVKPDPVGRRLFMMFLPLAGW